MGHLLYQGVDVVRVVDGVASLAGFDGNADAVWPVDLNPALIKACPFYKLRPAQKPWYFGCPSHWLGWLHRRMSR